MILFVSQPSSLGFPGLRLFLQLGKVEFRISVSGALGERWDRLSVNDSYYFSTKVPNGLRQPTISQRTLLLFFHAFPKIIVVFFTAVPLGNVRTSKTGFI